MNKYKSRHRTEIKIKIIISTNSNIILSSRIIMAYRHKDVISVLHEVASSFLVKYSRTWDLAYPQITKVPLPTTIGYTENEQVNQSFNVC